MRWHIPGKDEFPDMTRISRLLLWAASIIIVIAGLKLARDMIVPVLLGVMVAAASSPLVTFLLRKRLPPVLVAGIIVVLDVGVLALLGVAALLAASEASSVFPQYLAALDRADVWVSHELHGIWNVEQPLMKLVRGDQATSMLESMANECAGAASFITVVLLVAFFTLCEVTMLGDKLRAMTTDSDEHFARIDRILHQVQRYMMVKTGTSLLAGAAVFILLKICGVDLALLLAIVLVLLHFIPNVGAAIAMVPAVIVAGVSRGPGTAVIVACGYLTVNFVVGSVLEPRWFGRSLGLSPLAVLLSFLFWGWMWGPLGAVLSVPLLGVVKITCENIKELEWIARALEGAPDHSEKRGRSTNPLVRRPTFVLGVHKKA